MGQRHEAKAQALPAGARCRHFRGEEGTSVNVRRVPVVMRLREDADDGERLLDIVLYQIGRAHV